MRTSSPGPGGAAARANRLSFPGSSQASPTAPSSPSPLSNHIAAIGSGASLASNGPFSARLSPAHDWPSSSPAPAASGVAPIGSGLANKPAAFNPFDAEDDLLGPLK